VVDHNEPLPNKNRKEKSKKINKANILFWPFIFLFQNRKIKSQNKIVATRKILQNYLTIKLKLTDGIIFSKIKNTKNKISSKNHNE